MKYEILTVVPDQEGATPVKGLFDLHDIESATPDLVGKETWLQLKSGNTFLVAETPQQILDLINEG